MNKQPSDKVQIAAMRYRAVAELAAVLDAQVQCGRIRTARQAVEMLNDLVEDLQGDLCRWAGSTSNSTSITLTDPDVPSGYDLRLMQAWRKSYTAAN